MANQSIEFGSAIAESNFEDTELALGQLDQALKKKSIANTTMQLSKCPHCSTYHLRMTLANANTDGQANTTELGVVDKPCQLLKSQE